MKIASLLFNAFAEALAMVGIVDEKQVL